MKSPMVEEAGYIPAEDKKNYGELQVLQSGAGFYIGTKYWDSDLKFWDVGSRDSVYFPKRKHAEDYLDSAIKAINAGEHWTNFFRENP